MGEGVFSVAAGGFEPPTDTPYEDAALTTELRCLYHCLPRIRAPRERGCKPRRAVSVVRGATLAVFIKILSYIDIDWNWQSQK